MLKQPAHTAHAPNLAPSWIEVLTTPNKVYILLFMTATETRERLFHLAQTCAGINLRRASRAITHSYDRQLLAACDLRATQVPLLVVLHLAGPLTINEMAERLELDRTTLSRNLKPLEERGLLSIALGEDQRTRLVAITEAGTHSLLQALPVWEAAQAKVEQALGDERFQTLLKDLADLTKLTDQD